MRFSKINILFIIKRHSFSLLCNENGKIRISDVFIFLIAPLALSCSSLSERVKIDISAFSTSIAAFSIFGALLFSAQVALFGIAQRDEISLSGKNLVHAKQKIQERLSLIRELNTNISFLIILCIFISSANLIFIIIPIIKIVESFIFIFSSSFFLLNIILVIKRMFILFDVEYK